MRRAWAWSGGSTTTQGVGTSVFSGRWATAMTSGPGWSVAAGERGRQRLPPRRLGPVQEEKREGRKLAVWAESEKKGRGNVWAQASRPKSKGEEGEKVLLFSFSKSVFQIPFTKDFEFLWPLNQNQSSQNNYVATWMHQHVFIFMINFNFTKIYYFLHWNAHIIA
jgi:hypothetical protein